MVKKIKQYQQKFLTLEEALKDAKKQSTAIGAKLYVIGSRHLFFVDTNGTVRDNETLHATYEEGKKIKS